MEETTRAELLADPSIILDDKELMESLLTATDIKLGNNVVHLRHVISRCCSISKSFRNKTDPSSSY